MNNMIDGVTYIKGVDGGPKVCIMGALHGNEKVGGKVVEILADELSGLEIFGEIYLVIGNPLAYEKGVRFVETDINRLFGDGGFGDSIEGQRAQKLASILGEVDFLLDIHSTIKPSEPFVYCENGKEHVYLASVLGPNKIVSPSKIFRPDELVSSADNFVDKNGGVGITFESGWCEDMNVVDDVLDGAKKFLQKVKFYDFGYDLDDVVDIAHFEIYDEVVPGSDKFMFSKDYSGFDFVEGGEVIASDNGEAIEVEQDSYIIFPKKDVICGKAACYLAQKL